MVILSTPCASPNLLLRAQTLVALDSCATAPSSASSAGTAGVDLRFKNQRRSRTRLVAGCASGEAARQKAVPAGSAAAMSFCAFSGGEVYQNHFEPGIYVCSKCGYELFSSKSKYPHSSPWPAFTETIHADSVSKYPERPGALKVSCGKCGNGLGHEFIGDGPKKGQSRF